MDTEDVFSTQLLNLPLHFLHVCSQLISFQDILYHHRFKPFQNKTFSITTGSNPFKSWKTRVHFKIIFYSNINESGKMVNCDIFRSHFILGVFNYNVLILNILS